GRACGEPRPCSGRPYGGRWTCGGLGPDAEPAPARERVTGRSRPSPGVRAERVVVIGRGRARLAARHQAMTRQPTVAGGAHEHGTYPVVMFAPSRLIIIGQRMR